MEDIEKHFWMFKRSVRVSLIGVLAVAVAKLHIDKHLTPA